MPEMVQYKDILLAEDDHEDVYIFELALKELQIPYEIRHAENGDVMFMLLKQRIPYILFLDIHMPCKDGVACIQEIRRHREYDALPIVMYTSLFNNKIVEECFRNGANLFMTKTTTFAHLTEKLRKVFSIDWQDYLHYPSQNQFVLS